MKEKAKIHTHEPQQATIKGSNIYTVNRALKIKGIAIDSAKKKIQSEKRGISKIRKNVKESNKSVKVKNTNLHLAGAVGAKVASDQMEGGKEVQQAAMYAYGTRMCYSSIMIW